MSSGSPRDERDQRRVLHQEDPQNDQVRKLLVVHSVYVLCFIVRDVRVICLVLIVYIVLGYQLDQKAARIQMIYLGSW